MKRDVKYALEQDEDDTHVALDDVAQRAMPGKLPWHTRRLSNKVLVAFHHACDVSDLQVAERLLELLEVMLTQRAPHPGDNRRRSIESLVAAHERLWHLRHLPTS